MNRSVKRSIAFVLVTIIIGGLLDAFSAWAISRLDPAVQEAIGSLNSPWVTGQGNQELVGVQSEAVVDHETGSDRPKAAFATSQ